MATHSAPREFAVVPPTTDPRLNILFFVVVPELLVLLCIWLILQRATVPTPMRPSVYTHQAFGLPILAIFAASTAFLFWAAQRRCVVLADDVLDVTATAYRRKLPVAEFDLDNAAIVNLDERRELRPFLRVNAFSQHGLRAGWYRSRKWKRLFCLLTEQQRVLLLPLRAGGAVLLSVENPTGLLHALRAVDDGARLRR